MECPAKNNLEAEVGEGGATLETSLSTGPSCLAGALAQDFRGSEGVREGLGLGVRAWDPALCFTVYCRHLLLLLGEKRAA